MKKENSSTSQKLRQIRHQRHMTQAEFADAIGVSRTHYSNIENETVTITDKVLKKISMKFSISMDYLKGITDEEPEQQPDINRNVVYNLPAIRIGKRMKELRESRGLDVNALVDVLEVSTGIYSQYEQGTMLPDIEILLRLSYFYNVSADWLLGVTEKTNIQGVLELLDSLPKEICSDTDAENIMELLTFPKGIVLYFAGNELADNEEWKKITKEAYDRTNALMAAMKKEGLDCDRLYKMLLDYDAVKDQIKGMYGHACYLNEFRNGIRLVSWAAGNAKAKDIKL